MSPGWFQILIVILLVVMLFGRGKISDVMGDFAKGIKSFKKGLSDEDEDKAAADRKSIEARTAATVDPAHTPARDNVRTG